MSKSTLKDKYTFNIADYQLINEIKRGGFGVVNLVKNKSTKEKFAAKTNLIDTGISMRRGKQLISREVGILIRVKHPTIIRFQGYSTKDFSGNRNITILMDYMKGGSLSDLIKLENKGLAPSNYDNTKRQIILIGISRGMMLLHQLHIIHRDIKPENILLDENLQPRITDFGLSKFFDPLHSMSQSKSDTGTAPYMAPEVIESEHYNTKADVYAFGILMNEVLSGKRAYINLLTGPKRITLFQLKKKVCEGLRPDIDSKMKKGLRSIIKHCLAQNPKERPSFREIFNKLSLSQDDSIFQFEDSFTEPNVINDLEEENDDDEEEDTNEIDESDPSNFLLNMRYCLDDVDETEILDYVDKINQDVNEKTSNSNDDDDDEKDKEIARLKEMIDEIKAREKEKDEQIKQLKEQVSELKAHEKTQDKNLENLQEQIDQMRKSLNEIKTVKNTALALFVAEPSLDSPGLLEQLKKSEITKFNPLFISSQSTNDCYNLIDPKSNDAFGTDDSGKFFIEIELEESIKINGIQIFADTMYIPKSFDISINEKVVKSIKEAKELNGANKVMTIKIDSIQCKKFKFIQTGPNWDKNDNFIHIKRIELLSSEPKYSEGVFSTLVKNNGNDPHKSHVFVKTSIFDINDYYLVDRINIVSDNICTYSYKNSWFQVELAQGFAILTGFRMKRTDNGKLKSYKIICTDDKNKPINEWSLLIEINEKRKDEHQTTDIYRFPHASLLAKFARIVMTGPNWSDLLNLKFIHFDLFGKYI